MGAAGGGTVTFADVAAARDRLARFLAATPLETAPALGAEVWLKLENASKTHAFKIRGALNALLSLDATARQRGVVAASTGNHAQGIACAAQLVGMTARIVMPFHAAKIKVERAQRWGAEVILHGESYAEAEHEARRLEATQEMIYISPYNDPRVIAGQGTIGLEIVEALPHVQRVIVPIGGGGLISGIGLSIKHMKPDAEVVGVCLARAPNMYNLYYGTHLAEAENSLADALPGGIERDSITVPLARQHTDRIVLVDEQSVAAAMRWMVTEGGWLAEGGGVVGVAALQTGAVTSDDRVTVVVISGANVDAAVLARVLGGSGAHDYSG